MGGRIANDAPVQWRRLLVEGFAIVLSILAAFALDAWWDEQRDVAEEGRHLRALAADFEANQTLLSRYEAMYRHVDRATRLLIDLLESQGIGAAVQVPDSLLTASAFTATYDPNRAAYDALLGGPGLTSIRDEELRRRLAAWLPELEDAVENERYAAQLVYQELLPLLGESVDLGGVFALSEEYWVTTGFPDEWKSRTTEVRVSQSLLNLLRQRAWRYWLTLEEFGRLRTAQDAVLEGIEVALDQDPAAAS